MNVHKVKKPEINIIFTREASEAACGVFPVQRPAEQ